MEIARRFIITVFCVSIAVYFGYYFLPSVTTASFGGIERNPKITYLFDSRHKHTKTHLPKCREVVRWCWGTRYMLRVGRVRTKVL